LKKSYGRIFDGDDYIDCGRNGVFNVSTNDFSVGGWFYIDALGSTQYFVSKGGVGAGGQRFRLFLEGSNDKIYLNLDDNTTNTDVISTDSVSATTWYNFFGTTDRDGNLNFYKNGVAAATPVANNTALSISDTGRDLCIGVSSHDESSGYLSGRVGEVWFYPARALSAAEILYIYNVTRGRY